MTRELGGGWGDGLVYLAGGIDAITPDAARSWREEVIGDERGGLTFMGFSAFSPAHAFKVNNLTEEIAEAVVEVNELALRKSTAVVANLTGQTFGTPVECEIARGLAIPVFCFGGSERSVYRWRYNCWERTYGLAMHHFGQWARNRGR